ncbi:Pol protein [Phytophthora palmivora]|uniref:Pol protein n=1 Tax=Phytophthora palmivora TaxID=4796 RepID=A0A2P4Y9K8_9STRA|nr:Pol protein [Phytophthora palmivora]
MDRGEFPHLTDSQFESVRKVVGIFGGDALRSLAAATPAEQVERIKAFDTYERGLIAHVQGLQIPVAEMKPVQPKQLRLKVNPYEGKEGENLHFWVREVELAMAAALISTGRLRVAFALSNLGGKDDLKVGPSRTQLFRVHANTVEEAIQIALQEEYSHRQARTPTSVWQGHNASTGAVQGAPAAGASTGPVPNELSLSPESLGALETRKSSGGLLVVHASVRGYGDTFRIQIDSGPSTNFARHQTVTRNGDKYADALRESEGRGLVSVRLADGTVVNVPGVWMDLAVKSEDFDSTESFLVLDMDKCDLILGIPWLEKHEPWIGRRGKAIGASPARSLRQSFVPHKVEETEKIESAAGVSSVGNRVPRGIKKTSTSEEVSLSTSRVYNQVPHSESETPPARPVEEQCHVFDGVSGRQIRAGAVHLEALPEVSALLNLEELSMKDFLVELKTGEIAEMVLLKPETSPEDLNSSSILKNPEDPVYPLVKEYSDVVSKHPPSQLPPDRGVRHEIDIVPGTKYCVTRQWPIPHEQYEVIDAFFAEKAKSGMVRESKSPHSTPTFCVRKPNEKWRLVHTYNKLNNAAVPAQTPIPRKDVLLNIMSGCTLYSALDLVDGYYQILMRESDIPLTATYFDDIFVHSRTEGGQTATEVHLKYLRRVFEES